MGKKIGLSSYQKLSVLLVQSITRGSTDLFLRLKEEEEGAFFEKKEQAKRKGEQASTKLLAPMMVIVGCYLSIIDVSSTIYIFIKGQGVKHMRNFLKHFFKDESGMGVVEVILIIVVLIGLVIIFQTQIKKVVDSIFKTITSKTGQVK